MKDQKAQPNSYLGFLTLNLFIIFTFRHFSPSSPLLSSRSLSHGCLTMTPHFFSLLSCSLMVGPSPQPLISPPSIAHKAMLFTIASSLISLTMVNSLLSLSIRVTSLSTIHSYDVSYLRLHISLPPILTLYPLPFSYSY